MIAGRTDGTLVKSTNHGANARKSIQSRPF
ncbi:hypothetical protein BH24ACT23_BH24ACT23_11880 [soil metagenome]